MAWKRLFVVIPLFLAACGDNERPPLCGNGRLDPPEKCDPGIAAPATGACPASAAACDDGNDCTDDTATGAPAMCAAECVHTPIPDCGGSPCGNGVVDSGETCDIAIAAGDPGACPTSADCNDGDACTADSVQGVGCQAACSNAAITAADPDTPDLCCPAGADATTDADCSPTCGNGVQELLELCDTGIPAGDPGACPQAGDCDDGDACTTDTLISGGTCNAHCSFVEDVPATDGDGCCPDGANANTDDDCTAVCGNGAVEGAETCDPAIPAGAPGACPTVAADCDDGDVCTVDSIAGAGCAARCDHPVLAAGALDGCCPPGANNNTDPDCDAVCGNGVVETGAGESCDIALPGSCPDDVAADCSDGNACTTDRIEGAGCGTRCAYDPIIVCSLTADGCCRPFCTGLNDADCSATCGNGSLEGNETCDDSAGVPCPATPADCDDGDPCTTDDVQSPGTCNAVCVHAAVTSFVNSDGCCPAVPGANNNVDNDCPVVCDNGAIEAGETCDPLSTCPTSCNDGDTCTTDTLQFGGTCQAACQFSAITPCCGNGVKETGETCDINAPPGPDACPSSCDDGNACTTDTLENPGTCQAACSSTNLPPPCCGDGIVTSPETLTETCDDGPGSPRPCSTITCNDGISCTDDTPLLLGGNACRKICPHAAINDTATSDGCCPPQSRFGEDLDCVCGGLGVNAPIEQCDDANTTNNDVCTNSCTYVDGPDADTDPTVADVVGAPCASADPMTNPAGNCSYATNGHVPAGAAALCVLPSTLPPYTNGVVNGYCSISPTMGTPCDPTTTDGGDADLVPENIDSCPQLATLAQIEGGLAQPNSVCVTFPPGLPLCVSLCSPAAGQNLCRRTELGPLAGVLGPTLGGWAYRCMPVSMTAGICVPRDLTF